MNGLYQAYLPTELSRLRPESAPDPVADVKHLDKLLFFPDEGDYPIRMRLVPVQEVSKTMVFGGSRAAGGKLAEIPDRI